MNPEQFREKFFELIKDANNILITSHKNPDDDSISSVLAIYRILQNNLKISSKLIDLKYADTFPSRWKTFSDFTKVNFDKNINDNINKYDLIIIVDTPTFERAGIDKTRLVPHVKTINIDHHGYDENKDNFDLEFNKTEFVSATHIIFELFKHLDFDKETAELITLGIIADSGSLTYIKPKNSSALLAVEFLINKYGVLIEQIKSRVMNYPRDIFDLMKRFMQNSSFEKVAGWPEFFCAYIDEKYIEESNIDFSKVKEASNIFIANFGKSIEDVNWGITIYPLPDGDIRISMRSIIGCVSVKDLAEKFGTGSGHPGASAMFIHKKDYPEVNASNAIEIFKNWLRNNKPTFS